MPNIAPPPLTLILRKKNNEERIKQNLSIFIFLHPYIMSTSIFLLWLVSIPLLTDSAPDHRGYSINCGDHKEITQGGIKYIPDEGFISVGNKSGIKTPGLLPVLSTLRYFPNAAARKYCYVLPTMKGGKYLVRTIYYYGGYDGGKKPPVFDQIIQGTKWSTVDTSDDYAKNMTSYYEIVVVSMGKTLSVCLARNENTTSSPFISALEVDYLENSMYNTTDFRKYVLSTVARHTFGSDEMISFPDDQFNRLWQPFVDKNPVVLSQKNVTSSEIWNLPPQKAFTSAITASEGKSVSIEWPPFSLPSTKYYIALYFQDNWNSSPYSWRIFNVSINGQTFYKDLNATMNGVTVYASEWPLSGQTNISLTPGHNESVGPLINCGEIFQILPFGARTVTRDVMAMEDFARSLDNPPPDWSGDPCLPHEHSWTGVRCSQDRLARIVSLNLTNMGIVGRLPSSIGNLTAISNLLLGGNKLSGFVPDMRRMEELQTLHLENNQFEGSIPQSLGHLGKLRELFLQNNKFSGQVPSSIRGKKELNLEV